MNRTSRFAIGIYECRRAARMRRHHGAGVTQKREALFGARRRSP